MTNGQRQQINIGQRIGGNVCLRGQNLKNGEIIWDESMTWDHRDHTFKDNGCIFR